MRCRELHGSRACVTGSSSERHPSQRVDSLPVGPMRAFDSGEDLRMRSRSWEDDSRSRRLSWQRQRNLVISTNAPDDGNPEGAI